MPLAAMLLSWRFNRSSATIPLPTRARPRAICKPTCVFQSLKRDHSSSDRTSKSDVLDYYKGFNRSSATIPLPTKGTRRQALASLLFQSLKRDHSSSDNTSPSRSPKRLKFQSLKRDHSSSDTEHQSPNSRGLQVSIAQARPFLFRRQTPIVGIAQFGRFQSLKRDHSSSDPADTGQSTMGSQGFQSLKRDHSSSDPAV